MEVRLSNVQKSGLVDWVDFRRVREWPNHVMCTLLPFACGMSVQLMMGNVRSKVSSGTGLTESHCMKQKS